MHGCLDASVPRPASPWLPMTATVHLLSSTQLLSVFYSTAFLLASHTPGTMYMQSSPNQNAPHLDPFLTCYVSSHGRDNLASTGAKTARFFHALNPCPTQNKAGWNSTGYQHTVSHDTPYASVLPIVNAILLPITGYTAQLSAPRILPNPASQAASSREYKPMVQFGCSGNTPLAGTVRNAKTEPRCTCITAPANPVVARNQVKLQYAANDSAQASTCNATTQPATNLAAGHRLLQVHHTITHACLTLPSPSRINLHTVRHPA